MGNILYTGLELPAELAAKEAVHCPLITIIPRSKEQLDIVRAFEQLHLYTHIIFTSKSAVTLFFDYARHFKKDSLLKDKTYVAVGKKTAAKIKHCLPSAHQIHTADQETAEGVIELLAQHALDKAFIFWPHSALSRDILVNWLNEQRLAFITCVLYDTYYLEPPKDLNLKEFEEIVFTSPSTVDAFLHFFSQFPESARLHCIGPVTQKRMDEWTNGH